MVQKNKIYRSRCSGMHLAISQLADETLIITCASVEKLFFSETVVSSRSGTLVKVFQPG